MARKIFGTLADRGKKALHCSQLSGVLGARLHSPQLWHLNRHTVAWAVSVGLFMSFIPVPFQMLLAGVAAVLIGCNLPISVAVVWVSNPITMPPMFYGAYRLGAWLLGDPSRPSALIAPDGALSTIFGQLGATWKPFLLGCLIAAVVSAALGHALVRMLWRLHVSRAWSRRRAARYPRHTKLDGSGT